MSGLTQIGTPPWVLEDIEASLDEFLVLYARRPIRDNQGGMKAPHMFAVWFMVRKLKPDLIVESGVWKGQGTWLLEQASAGAELFSIDIDLTRREYISERAIYFDRDFSMQDWSRASDRSLAFFDDHQSAYDRLQQCKWFGFKNVIFEDNYPPGRGDCYTLKQAFAGAGFGSPSSRTGTRRRLADVARRVAEALGIAQPSGAVNDSRPRSAPSGADAAILQKNLDTYYEFPPVLKTNNT